MFFLLSAFLQFPAIAPDLADRLNAGEIVVELETLPDGMPRGRSTGLVGATLARTWALMTDFDRYSSMYTGIPRSHARRRANSHVHVYLVMDLPWPLPDRWVLTEFRVDPERYTLDWRRLEGSVKRYDGAAKFTTWPGERTLMQFDAVYDPGLPFLPNWLLAYFTAQSLPGVVSGPRDYMERTAKAAR